MNPHITLKTVVLLLGLLLGRSAFAEEDAPGQPMPATSPDGRFVFRQLEEQELAKLGKDQEAAPAVFELKTGTRVLSIPDDMFNSFTATIRVVWSKDSTRVAFNYRSGARYFTTALYKVDGTKFISIPSPEETLSTVVHNEMVAESKRQGLKPGENERRIHDAFTTSRWLDGNTVEVDAESTRTVTYKVKGEEELTDISAALHCTAKFDPKTQKWKVIKSVKFKSE